MTTKLMGACVSALGSLQKNTEYLWLIGRALEHGSATRCGRYAWFRKLEPAPLLAELTVGLADIDVSAGGTDSSYALFFARQSVKAAVR